MQRPEVLFSRAERARESSRYRRALQSYKVALHAFSSLGRLEGVVDCQLAIGDTLRMTGEFDQAITYYEDALELADDPLTIADCHVGIGLSRRALGDWAGAFKQLKEADTTYVKKGDRRGHAFTRWGLAGTYRIRGDLHKALHTYDDALGLYRGLRDRRGTGYCYNGLGGASRIAGLYRDSEKYYSRANQIFERLNDRFGKAYSYCGLGNARRMRGDYSGALDYFRRAAYLYKRIGDRVSYAYTLWSVATTHKMLGHLRRSHRYFDRADALFMETHDPRGRIYCQLGYGELRLLGGDAAGARRFYRKGLNSADKYGFQVEAAHARMLLGRKPEYERLGMKSDFSAPPHNLP